MKRHLTLLPLMLIVFVGCQPPSPTGDVPTADQPEANATLEAVANLVSIGESGVSGTVQFSQEGETVHVHGKVMGLSPGKHGFHIHETGDLSDKETGKSVGGHYNPTDQPHGRLSDSARHAGDLGNIEAGEDGTAVIDIHDTVIQLDGEHSIVGRAVVVHAQEDQFTQPSGDAGDRVAFGKIEAKQ